MTYQSKGDTMQHRDSVYERAGFTKMHCPIWICTVCGAMFTTPRRRPKTYKAIHQEGPKFGCKLCWVDGRMPAVRENGNMVVGNK